MPSAEPSDAYWSRSAADLLAELGASVQGLTAQEAAQRLRAHGPNAVEDQRQLTPFRLLLRQFASPMSRKVS